MTNPAHLTDAELAAWYGSGLHAPKAQRLIEEVRRLRARLAEVEAERDEAMARIEDFQRLQEDYFSTAARWQKAEFRAEAAEDRLAAAVDRLEMFKRVGSMDPVTVDGLTAILRGEGDRPAEVCSDCGEQPCMCGGGWGLPTPVTRDRVQANLGMTEEQMDGLIRHFGISPETVRPIEEMERGEGDRPAFDPNCPVCDHNAHTCPGCGADTDHAHPVCARCGDRP